MSRQSLRAAVAVVERRPLGPLPDDDDDLVAAVDRNLVDALGRWDPGARVSRRLAVTVDGAGVAPGRLDAQVSEQLLHAVRREVQAAAPGDTPAGAVRLELTGIGAGSAVLYLEPATDSPERGDDELVQPPDPLDDAVRGVLDLHGAAESQADLGRFAGSKALLQAFDALTESLDAHDLSLGMVWRARTGSQSQASLTRVGRDHARPFLARIAASEDVELTGRVTVLDIDGGFTLRASTARNAARHDVRLPEGLALTELGLQLGSTVTVRVRRTVARAPLGLESRPRYLFLGLVGRDSQLA